MTKISIPKSDAFAYLGFDLSDIQAMTELSGRSDMWKARLEFVVQLRDMNRNELSAKQKQYAVKILDDLDLKRRKGIV